MNEGFDNQYPNMNMNGDGNKGMAIAAMILGIVSIVLCCIWYISIIAGVVAIVLGIMYNKKNGKCGMSTAGILCGIIGMILAIALIVIAALGLAALGGMAALEGYM